MRKQICIYFLSAWCSLFQLCAEITLTLDRTTIGFDEAITANFSSNSSFKGQPDFKPLTTDFEIISTSQNYMTSSINGKTTLETCYQLILRPKHVGHLIIPPIWFGNEQSPHKTIEVTNMTTAKPDNTLFLETKITTSQPTYPQTQIIYTVRLFRAVNLAQAGLSEVKVNDSDAIIEKLGKDAEYEYIHPNGIRYIVLERRYGVFPQREGELIFSPIVFEGQVIKGGNSFFNMHAEFKRVTSNIEKVTVAAIPAPFQKNDWFAAKDLNLIEEWSANPEKINVGEPITWTLTLTAEGCLGSQIPDITYNLPSGVKQYIDKPEVSNSSAAKGFIGLRKIKTALIATKPGELILPELTVKWWDLNTNQLRYTHLPSRTIQVQEGAVAMETPSLVQVPKQIEIDTEKEPEANTAKNEISTVLPGWAWGLIGLNSIWMILLFKKIYEKFSRKFCKDEKDTFSKRQVKSLLKQACQENNAKQAEIYLLSWTKHLFPENNVTNLAQIIHYFPSPMDGAINELNRALYGQMDASWEGKSLWNALTRCKL